MDFSTRCPLCGAIRTNAKRPLTRRQRELLNYLRDEIARNGYSPSFEEIAQHFSFRSLATVHEHLTNLERKRVIRRYPNEARAIEIL